MSKFIWVTFTIVSSVISFQCLAQFSDDFSDGNFSDSPAWSGETDKFTVSSQELRLQAPAVDGTAWLSTESKVINNAVWEFSVRMQFNPSITSYALVYLASDQPDLSGSLNGYYVMIGDSPDEVSLYLQTGTKRTRIIDGKDKTLNASNVSVRVKVTRDALGNWELFSDSAQTGTYRSEGAVQDLTHEASAYMGVYCKYIGSRSDDIFFDNFSVTGDPYVEVIDHTPYPLEGEVIITEIFADPAPVVGLPESEYIEIYNRGSVEYKLTNCQITDGTSAGSLEDRKIAPGRYLILTRKADESKFSAYADVMGIDKFPSLNNAGDNLMLKSPDDVIIDAVSYGDSWYRSSEKKEGGWSLEIIDPENLCEEQDNWTASEDDLGGTPGTQNSVFANKPDLAGPGLLKIFPLSPFRLKVSFNEKLDAILPSPENFVLTPAVPIDAVSFSDSMQQELLLTLQNELAPSVLYTLKCEKIYDCSGNIIQPEISSLSFALPEKALPGDIVLNEVLFNPLPLGVDFVEVYNTSSRFINLKNWSLANVEGDSLENKKIITTEDVLIQPEQYLVFTSDGATLKGQYVVAEEQNFLQASLPSLPDDEGSIAIVDDESNKVDQFVYSNDMHSPFIKDDDGVSLERVSFSSPTEDTQNWKSGTSSTGYATPGYLNANSRPAEISTETIEISPEVFEPVSGQPDFAQIQYKFEQGGYVANVKIFDAQGRMIKHLANNDVLGTEGFYRWDGDKEDGTRARIGYYFVWFQVFNAEGAVKTFRKPVAIAARF